MTSALVSCQYFLVVLNLQQTRQAAAKAHKLFLLFWQKSKVKSISICKYCLRFYMDFFLPLELSLAIFVSHFVSKLRNKHCQKLAKSIPHQIAKIFHICRCLFQFSLCHNRKNSFRAKAKREHL